MTVYVDNMRRQAEVQSGCRVVSGRWSHMLADTHDELVAFARRLGLSPAWLQHAGTHREHFDLTERHRREAVRLGAVEIDYPHGTGRILAAKRADRHVFAPDLLGDCTACPLPLDNPIHIQAEPVVCTDKACAATSVEGCKYPGWMMCAHPPEQRTTMATAVTATVVLDPNTHARTSDPDTSHSAASELSDKATMMRRLLGEFTLAAEFGTAGGLTAEEASEAAGFTAEDGAWKRVSDLKAAGWIEPTGDTRPGSSGRKQQVCRITDKGREALR